MTAHARIVSERIKQPELEVRLAQIVCDPLVRCFGPQELTMADNSLRGTYNRRVSDLTEFIIVDHRVNTIVAGKMRKNLLRNIGNATLARRKRRCECQPRTIARLTNGSALFRK